MKTRPAKPSDLDYIYLMGKDVWGIDTNEQQYLEECHASEKYKLGQWYCLEINKQLISSLITYKNMFQLNKSSVGIGSVATVLSARNKGYASMLIQQCIEKLTVQGYSGVYLFSETNSTIYKDCGFEFVHDNSNLMFLSINGGTLESNPTYF